MNKFVIYLLACSITTYLIRAIPLVIMKEKIKNKYLLSFMHYLPSTILAVMTVPSVFSATGNIYSSMGAFAIAIICAIKGMDIIKIAICSSLTVLLIELIITYLL